jgi:hypothetical protein
MAFTSTQNNLINTINIDSSNNRIGIGDNNDPVSLLDVRGSSGGILTLSTSETTVRVGTNDQIGRINFQAPQESDGSDAILVGASIHAECTADFSSTNNSTAIVFSTATTTAPVERLRLDETGQLGIGVSPNAKLTVEGTIKVKEQASAESDTGAYGQIWVKNTSPNELYFTTDAGDDIQLTDGTSAVGGGLLGTDVRFGEDAETCIDFTTTNNILFKVNNVEHILLDEGADTPGQLFDNHVQIGHTNTDANVLIGTGGDKLIVIGSKHQTRSPLSLSSASGIFYNYKVTTVTDSANDPDAQAYCQGFINCTGGGADTWTLPTGPVLHDRLQTLFKTVGGYSQPGFNYNSAPRHEGVRFTTYVLNNSGGTITYAAGASGSEIFPATCSQATGTLARLDFMFIDIHGSFGSENYSCYIHCKGGS